MRKTTLLLCCVGLCLMGCDPRRDKRAESREVRPYPDPTLGTENAESQWYKTQVLAAPSAPSAPTGANGNAVPAKKTAARLAPTAVPSTPAPPSMGPTGAK